MANDQTIINHYKNVAQQFGLTSQSSMQDQAIREAETSFFKDTIESLSKGQEKSILDCGCGNAFTLSQLSPHHSRVGLEFSPDLYNLAQQRVGVSIYRGDMRTPLLSQLQGHQSFDIVITQRSVINLLGRDQQVRALENIADAIRPGGFYLLSESFYETHSLLNHARAEFGLEEISPSKHNLFLTESRLATLKKHGLQEVESTYSRHHLSTHFYLTRVLHPHLRGPHGKMKAPHFLEFFTQGLGTGIGTYSPIQFRVFQKEMA